jgi:hypothetical protein
MDGNAFNDWPPAFEEDYLNHVMALDESGLPFLNQYMQSCEAIDGYDGKHTTQIRDHSIPNIFDSSIHAVSNLT